MSRLAWTALLLVCAVSAVSLLYFSPVHRHDPRASRACPFTLLEHGYSMDGGAVVGLAPPVLFHHTLAPAVETAPAETRRTLQTGRAPPA